MERIKKYIKDNYISKRRIKNTINELNLKLENADEEEKIKIFYQVDILASFLQNDEGGIK